MNQRLPVASDPVGHLDTWAAARPGALALLHKRRGRWMAWRWADVRREVAELSAALAARGFGPGERLALAGPFEPTLVLLALGARNAGGEVVAVSPDLSGQALLDGLSAAGAHHLFVASRDGASRAIAAYAGARAAPRLYLREAPAQRSAGLSVTPIAELFGEPRPMPERIEWDRLRSSRSAWVEEGSEWAEGLGLILERLLTHGQAFAFPENAESASRDRCDIAPVMLLLSAARAGALHDKLDQRLAPSGSLGRRLWDWAQRHAGRPGAHRHLRSHVRRIAGLHRVRAVEPAALVASAWLGTGREELP
ncbi:AMP-binding protein [Zoogloea sp.]|uniref:AMP-binding protein n=1 Tax=Zoogloea sp. TaxID=49181 RepID=UPI0031FDB02F